MDKKETILDRVILFSESINLSLRSFSLSIGASAGYLHRLKSAGSNIGGDFIEKVIDLHPEVNPVWLVTGKGAMLNPVNELGEPQPNYGQEDYFKKALLSYLDDEDIQSKLKKWLREVD